jgi:hypothetical protein
MIQRSTYFVYVHLGSALSPNLLANAQSLKKLDDKNQLILITDEVDRWSNFPGIIHKNEISAREFFPFFYRLKYFDKFSSAKGYWINSLLRLFVLPQIRSLIPHDARIFHVESDVQVYLNQALSNLICANLPSSSACQFDDNLGIASILYFPDINLLEQTIHKLKTLLFENLVWQNDMELIGQAIKLKILDVLPSGKTTGVIATKYGNFCFDPASIGQYLFGRDPIHQNNLMIGGYISPFANYDLNKGSWSITYLRRFKIEILEFSIGRNRVFFLNLHLHSKIVIPNATYKNQLWKQAIEAANGKIPFALIAKIPQNTIHSDNGTLPGRIIRRIRNIK